MRYVRGYLVRGFFLLTVVLSPINVSMAALDRFDPYAFARVLRDSNIFRVSGDFEDQESDTIGYFGAGLNSDWKLSRQHLLLDLEVTRAKYDSLDELDHTRVDGTGTWAWEIGNLWSGTLGYGYSRDLSSFDQTISTEKDMRTTHTGFFSAGYQLHPDWKVIGGLEYSDASYQDQEFLDRDTGTGSIEVQYRNTRNTYVGVRVRYSKNNLRDTDVSPGISIDNDYDEIEVGGVFTWQGSDKSTLEANLGYTDLNYDEQNDRDFQGSTGRLTYYWAMSEKTNIDFSVWRETSSLYDEITTYVLQKGISITPSWFMTRKVSLRGRIAYTNDDFKGRNDIVTALGGQRRDEDTWVYAIGAIWAPRDPLTISLDYRREERDSSINSIDYNDDQVEAAVKYSF